MAEHVALVPSQVANPWRAVWRTVVQVGIPAFVLVLTVGPEILRILSEDLGAHLPPGVISWLLGAAALLTALSGAISRIMAIARVNEALRGVKLDAGKPTTEVVP